MQKTHIADA